LLEAAGYRPVTHFADMLRPDLDDIPEAALPAGLEVRPVMLEHYRAIWEAEVEAFQDHWGASFDEKDYQRFLDEPTFGPALWRIAWDGDQVAGQVRSYIDSPENEEFGRRRGYAENISVRRPWRRQGLARALLVESLHALKRRGMEQAALGVHFENPRQALQLYESVGFGVVRMNTTVRKPLD
jgi:ribosomal protein S18 acetylase RimI-like enzyme